MKKPIKKGTSNGSSSLKDNEKLVHFKELERNVLYEVSKELKNNENYPKKSN